MTAGQECAVCGNGVYPDGVHVRIERTYHHPHEPDTSEVLYIHEKCDRAVTGGLTGLGED
jgi:hypothetical protein